MTAAFVSPAAPFTPETLTRAELDALAGPTVVEFGTNWCGHCRRAQPLVAEALATQDVRLLKIEDGPGRALGRSFGVKLWPTLVFLCDGREVAKLVRPGSADEIGAALAQIGLA